MNKSITRRVLAVIIVICAVGVLTYLSIAKSSDIAIGAIISTLGLVTGYYFGVTNKE